MKLTPGLFVGDGDGGMTRVMGLWAPIYGGAFIYFVT